MKIHHEQFLPSLQSLLDYTTNAESVIPDNLRPSRRKENSNWSGTDSFETALNLATYGWEEGLKKIRLLTKEITPKFYELFPRQDAGEELRRDVGGAYEDPVISDIGIDPLDMINFKSKFDTIKQGNSLQRLIIETGVSGCISPETLFIRGACILALLESLETFGFRIEVILQSTTKSTRDPNALSVIRTTLKTFEEHSDYDKFAFCIANSAFERRLMFSCIESQTAELVTLFDATGGHGYPHNHPLYMDKDRDFYMVRPLANQDIVQCMTETVELINKRYKGMIQTVDNPDLGSGEGGKMV
jgi:hypothetical protein